MAKKVEMSQILTPKKIEQMKIDAARKFGRVDSDGKVFVKVGTTEHQVGQYSTGEIDQEMTLFVRRFVDEVDKMELFAKRLEEAPNITAPEIDNAIQSFKEFGEQFNAVGDYVALQSIITNLEKLGDERRARNREKKQEMLDTAEKMLKEAVDNVEAILATDKEKINWEKAAKIASDAFDKWQEGRKLAHVPEAFATPLWERYQTARNFITENRREYISNRRTIATNVKQKKSTIISQAEAAKDTNDFDTGKRTFNRLMREWKEVGRGDKRADDKQWEKFKSIQDHFYSRLPKDEKPVKREQPKWDNDLSSLGANISGLDALAALKKQLEKGK